MSDDLVSRLRASLPGIAQEECGGDNLAILLASFFEPGIESDELDDIGTWKQGAIDACDSVLDAIHAHYATALTEARAEIERRDAFIKELSDALRSIRPLGGSELFVKRFDNYYADPDYCKAAIEQDAEHKHNAMKAYVKERRRALAAESELSTLRARVREVVRPFAQGLIDISGAAIIIGYPQAESALRAARQLNEDLK